MMLAWDLFGVTDLRNLAQKKQMDFFIIKLNRGQAMYKYAIKRRTY